MKGEVARLMGLEQREYTGQDGRQRSFCGLHLCYVEGAVSDVEGSKCENVSCPREVNPKYLQIGGLYQLEYELYQTKSGKAARLVGLEPVEEG